MNICVDKIILYTD